MNEDSKTVIVAFDGTAASGKGTIAKLLADKLGYDHLDTGMMFRKVAYYCYKCNINPNSTQEIIKLTKEINLEKIVNIKNIYSHLVTDIASKIATQQELRNILTDIQRNFVENKKGAIIDGRDIATIVFPNAQYKFFFDASINIRAVRRYKQLQKMGRSTTLSNVLHDLRIRDKRDKTRNISPLVVSKDSFIINTGELSVHKVLNTILNKIQNN